MNGLATVWVLASPLLAVLAPPAAASTQRISITVASEGATPGQAASTQIFDDLGRSARCTFLLAPYCWPNEIPNTQVIASASTITFVDHESPSTRCFRVHAGDGDLPGGAPSTPTSVRATFINPDGSQHTVGPFRMEDGSSTIYLGSTPAEADLTPGGPQTTTGGCDGAYYDDRWIPA